MWVMPHSHTLALIVSMAGSISRPQGLCLGIGVCAAGGGTTHRLLLLLHTKAIVQPSHTQAARCHAVTCMLAVVVVVNSLILMHYQCTGLG